MVNEAEQPNLAPNPQVGKDVAGPLLALICLLYGYSPTVVSRHRHVGHQHKRMKNG